MEGKTEKTFKNLGRKIDDMIEELADLKENLKSKYGDRWEEINRSKVKLESELYEFREKHKDRFEEAERSIEKAGEEIKHAFDAVFKKKNKAEGASNASQKGKEEKASEH